MTEQRPPEIRLYDDEVVVDNFAGGGGASTGIALAIGRSPDVAINHDPEALAMHAANHPDTMHLKDDVFHVDPVKALRGKRCGLAWFSPDCTFFSKAKGGKPFRDRNKARRVRGLIGVVLKWAANPITRPRVIVIENVEEIEDWCPLGTDGRPDLTKRGSSFRRWCARLRGYGYQLEFRKLRGCDYGAPTTRQRLFIIARCDGQAIVWPEPSHGRHRPQPHRSAAECIDFSLPVPSIFLTPAEAKAWGEFYGVAPPLRPLAHNTLRRVARGVFKFVLDHPQPFIVRFNSEKSPGAEFRGQLLSAPLTTLGTSNRFGLVTPFLAPVVHGGDDRVHSVEDPFRTIVASDREFALVAPTLINTRNGERHGVHGEQAPRALDIRRPWGTVTAHGSQGALVTAFLAKHYGGDRGNCAGRTTTVEDPIGTVTTSDHHTLVTAYLAKHNGGHEATGQELARSMGAITTRDQKALTTCHLLKLYGTCQDGAPVQEPAPTVTAHGNHIAAVYAFLVKFYGTAIGKSLRLPLDVVTTRERFGLVLVTIAGEEYVMVDIGIPIDGFGVAASVTRFTKEQASAFAIGFHRVRDPHASRLVSMRMPGEEQAREEPSPNDQSSDTRPPFVVSDAEIRRRRLVEMSDEQRAAYHRLHEEEETFAVSFVADSLASYLTIAPAQIAVEDHTTGEVREVTSGKEFANLYAGRHDVLLFAMQAIFEENSLSVPAKNALSSRRASQPSSGAPSEPTPTTTAAVGERPADPAPSAESEPSASSATATALSEGKPSTESSNPTSSGSTGPATT